jgi:hypothetical protein
MPRFQLSGVTNKCGLRERKSGAQLNRILSKDRLKEN